MAFKLYSPRGRFTAPAAGVVNIVKSGMATFAPADLSQVSIKTWAAILVDPDTCRLAVRAPREEEGFTEPAMAVKWSKRGSSARINLRGPLTALGLKLTACTGQHAIVAKKPDGLLIVNFPGASAAKAGAPSRKPKSAKR